MSRVVLDTSAVLAGFFREPGADAVADQGASGLLSTVNYSEVLSKLSDRGVALQDADRYLASLRLTEVAFDRDQAIVAASLRPLTRAHGFSFADRACLAAASLAQLPVLTADRQWTECGLGVEIILIR